MTATDAPRPVLKAREIGEYWEERFCELYWVERGGYLLRNQKGRREGAYAEALDRDGMRRTCLLPDVQVFSAPGEHHEVKHKNPHKQPGWAPKYGLEVYRFEALVAFAKDVRDPVLYTIHDWQLAGASNAEERTANRLQDWRTIDILKLERWTRKHNPRVIDCGSYRNGRWSPKEPTYLWPTRLWQPLGDFWSEHQPTVF